MTQSPGPTQSPTPNDANPGTGLDRFFDWLRSLDIRRDPDDKWLTGTSAGVARRLGVDPLVVRAGFVLLALLGGVGVTLYLIAWAFLPNGRDEILAERAVRQGEFWPIVLLAAIVLSLLGGTGFAHDGTGLSWFWWVAVPVAVVFWALRRNRRGEPAGPPLAYAAPAGAAPGAQPLAYAATAGTGTVPSPTSPPLPPSPPAPVAPRPMRAPRPPRPPRRRGPGFAGLVLVGGLALAA
jgi:phage shock protein PspC (stress-responsive transcriptional regulator)